jgi:crotonobetainyl-CoA:carnitine CoA-transferase CaiB-like acyl-CoA transferase
MVVEIPTPDGPIRAVGNPIKLDGCETRYQAPPLLGEHGGPVRTRSPA